MASLITAQVQLGDASAVASYWELDRWDAEIEIEKAGLRVRFPPEARKLGPISMALGNFGRAFYAGSLT
jgi:hypothetical protein